MPKDTANNIKVFNILTNKYCFEVNKLLKTHFPGEGEIKEYRPIEFPFVMSHMRCRSLYESILILLKKNKSEDALILTRSLLEDSLRMFHMFKSSTKCRNQHLAHWYMVSNNNLEKLLLSSHARSEEQASKIQKKIAQDKESLQDLMKKEKIQQGKKFPKLSDLVKNYMKDDYFAYLLSNHMVHGTGSSQSFRTVIDKQENHETIKLYTTYNSTILKIIVLYISIISILKSLMATSGILNWGNLEDIVKTIKDIRDLPEKYKIISA